MSTAAEIPTPSTQGALSNPTAPVTRSPELVTRLRAHLDGPFGDVRDHCRALDPVTFGPPPTPLSTDEHRARVTSQLAGRTTRQGTPEQSRKWPTPSSTVTIGDESPTKGMPRRNDVATQ